MKNKLLPSIIFLQLILSFSGINAQTNVSGFINANTNWNLAGSPYIIIGNVLLSHSYTLTIDPGVVIKFNDSCALQIDGELIAIGTPQNRITFTSNKVSPAAGDWAEIHFADTSVSAVFDTSGNYLSGCIMKYCDVLYGGETGYGNIQVESSSPYFSHCTIGNGSACGIYCHGSSYTIDSTVVNNCSGYGLSFDNITLNSCGITIATDTIENNRDGGVLITSTTGCMSEIKNNYFYGNATHGAINSNWSYADTYRITGNYFIQDSVNIPGQGIINVTSWAGTSSHVISDNYFQGNVKHDFGAMVVDKIGAGDDSITCNVFVNNKMDYEGLLSLEFAQGSNSAVIKNNVFDGNQFAGSEPYVTSVLSYGSMGTVYFEDNTIKNNLLPAGLPCVKFWPKLSTSTPLLYITGNNIINNTGLAAISLTGNTAGSTNFDFLRMKRNNLVNPNCQFELYNMIPYGSPDLYPDSNYWGGTSVQHIDSVIYDYFDNSGFSVVYYSNLLSSAVAIDTTCTGSFTNSIDEEAYSLSAVAFPNPFSQSTMICFDHEAEHASINFYNMYGQLVKSISGFSGKKFLFQRENLIEGIYFYSMKEADGKECNGKLVVN